MGVREEAVLEWMVAEGHRYAGEWVALREGEVVAHGAVEAKVREEARRQGEGFVVVKVEVVEGAVREIWK